MDTAVLISQLNVNPLTNVPSIHIHSPFILFVPGFCELYLGKYIATLTTNFPEDKFGCCCVAVRFCIDCLTECIKVFKTCIFSSYSHRILKFSYWCSDSFSINVCKYLMDGHYKLFVIILHNRQVPALKSLREVLAFLCTNVCKIKLELTAKS